MYGSYYASIASVQDNLKSWSPIPLRELASLFADAPFRWWVAGGLSIELALGRSLRRHSDIDMLVLRRDHLQLRTYLADWDCWIADPPGQLRIWPKGEKLGKGLHDVWCRESRVSDWRFQVMIDESDGNEWVSRRNASVRSALPTITKMTDNDIPFLAPHVQLYYKAKNPRPKDQVDFDAAIEGGVVTQIEWLKQAIRSTYGTDHAWLAMLPK